MHLNATLSWFQNKIGTYDKQSWERSVEKSILKGFSNIPKKSAKVKTDFIDVDLVRGSTFPKAKPQHGTLAIIRKAFFRTFLLPFFWTWWVQQTSHKFTCLLLALYVLQCSALFVYWYGMQFTAKGLEDTSLSEVLSPLVIMIVLGSIYSQVVSTTHPLTTSVSSFGRLKRKRLKRRRSSKTFAKSTMTTRRDRKMSGFVSKAVDDEIHDSTSGYKATKSSKNCLDSQSSTDSGLFLPSTQQQQQQQQQKPTIIPAEVGVRMGSSAATAPIDDLQTSDEATRHDSTIQDVSSVELETDPVPSDTEVETLDRVRRNGGVNSNGVSNLEMKQYLLRRRVPHPIFCSLGSSHHRHPLNSSGDSEGDTASSNTPVKDLPSTADIEWGMTTDGTDGEHSYESDSESEETDFSSPVHDDPFCWEYQGVNSSSSIFNPSCTASDKGLRSVPVSCTIWEGVECKKAELCAIDITSAIVRKVTVMPESTDYFVCGVGAAVAISLMPLVFRSQDTARDLLNDVTHTVDISMLGRDEMDRVRDMLAGTFSGGNFVSTYVSAVTVIERFFLSLFFFFLLSVAERTFKQRFLYAKLFSHITSSRRSRRSELPHFRLNKVRNIKTWLSVRSYLKKHGPQRSVDVIVSASFVIALLLISILCVQILKESEHFGEYLYNWEILSWCLALGIYLLRFMTLGAKINKKYRNLSVLLTEQINLYVQMEQKPQKKDGLVLANNVLKLASQLLKELESPFKISGFSANPYLYNITKLVILSAFSAVLTELFGFKLKLYKIKIK